MNIKRIIKNLILGAIVGCFISSLVEVFISLMVGPENISFSGVEIINVVLGSIVVGFGFSLPSFIYEREDIPLPLQTLFQMGFGLTFLFLVAIYLKWIPINLGLWPIITWILIALIFAVITWLCFYVYYVVLARDFNKKLEKSKYLD